MLNAGKQKNRPQEIQKFPGGNEQAERCLGCNLLRSQRDSKVS
jgi:hypothetical protein